MRQMPPEIDWGEVQLRKTAFPGPSNYPARDGYFIKGARSLVAIVMNEGAISGRFAPDPEKFH